MAEMSARYENGRLAMVAWGVETPVESSNTEGFLLVTMKAAGYDAAVAVVAGGAI